MSTSSNDGEGRRRRRAVGPRSSAGSPPAGDPAHQGLPPEPEAAVAGWSGSGWSDREEPAADDDERLLRDVPPHHGS